MKAAVVERCGPPEVVKLREVPTPVASDDEILVRARATTVKSGDARVRGINVHGGPVFSFLMRLALGFNGPKQPIQGFEMAGDVEAVGRNVTRYKVGDRVVGSHGFKFGLHAEYATFTDAVALLFGGMTSVILRYRLAEV